MIRASVTHLLLVAVFMRGHQLVHMNLAENVMNAKDIDSISLPRQQVSIIEPYCVSRLL